MARLGQHVGKVDGALQMLADDTRRKLMEQQQQQQHMTAASASSLSPTVRHHDFRRQQQLIDDLQRDLQQLRLESEAERSDWRRRSDDHDAVVERSRRQLIGDIQNRMAADKMEILTRLTDEWRQLVASTDAKRGVQISSELSRVNDHFADLERWLQGELATAKRVIQVLAVETDGKLQALAQSVVGALSATASSAAVSDDEVRVTLTGLQDALGEVTHRVQKKLATLEDVLPLEVKARQQGDDKLRRRIDSVLKAVEAARASTMEVGKQQRSAITSQIERKLDAARREMEAQLGESEAKALEAMREWSKRLKEEGREKMAQEERLRAAFEQKLEQKADREALEQKADREAVAALSVAQDRLREALASASHSHAVVPASPSSSRSVEREDHSTAIAAVEDKVQRLLDELSDRHNELLDLLQDLERRQQDDGTRVEALQTWTTTHASECRDVYDYVTWSLEASALDDQVRRVVGGLVEQIADAGMSDRVERLERRVESSPPSSTRLVDDERCSHVRRRSYDEKREQEDDDDDGGGGIDHYGLKCDSPPEGDTLREEKALESKDEDWNHVGEGETNLDDIGADSDGAISQQPVLGGANLGGMEATDLLDESATSGGDGSGESREDVYSGEEVVAGSIDDAVGEGYAGVAAAAARELSGADADLLSPLSPSPGGASEGDSASAGYGNAGDDGGLNDKGDQLDAQPVPGRYEDADFDVGVSLETAAVDEVLDL